VKKKSVAGRSKTKKGRKGAPRSASSASGLVLARILVPIDFSPHSKDALRYAVSLARRFHASIHLVYVVEPTIYPADLGFGQVVYPVFEDELIEKGNQELRNLLKDEVGTATGSTAIVRTGKPHQEILLEARERKVDLIVMATHGHSGVEHMLFGGTAERIVRHAKCPVLTVRPKE
jgi:nucleotide-binding universal stress UspA family protein